MTGGLVDTSHVFNISCLFVVIFYVISPSTAQILVGLRSRRGTILLPP